jgi:hypothetical protein
VGCSLAALAVAQAQVAAGAEATGTVAVKSQVPPPTISATLTQCVTSVNQEERSATFAGEMSAVPGTVRMAIRIDVEQRLPHDDRFRPVLAPNVGAWRLSELKVKVFKYIKQVTSLDAPARYRATVHFRWIGAHGTTLRRAARMTKVCAEPAAPRAL